MQGLAAAQKLFDRQIPASTSQADRDEQIGTISRVEQSRIFADLLADDSLRLKIADDIPGWISTETMAEIVLGVLKGEMKQVRELLLAELDEAVKREAESIALYLVE